MVVEAPVSWSGDLCNEADTCSLRPGPDVRLEVTIPTSGEWTFRSCGTVETVLSVDTVHCCGEAQQTQAYCSSALTVDLTAGQVVFVTVEAVAECGNFTLLVTGP